MKKKFLALVLILFLGSLTANAQKTDKKAEKQAKALEREKQVQKMLDAKEFVFVAYRALPSGGKSVDLTTNTNYVKFHPDLIVSYMPFFGRSYAGAAYDSDSGFKFEGNPATFEIKQVKKKNEIKVIVKGMSDSYNLSLTIFTDGSGTLNISSNNRSNISYQGEINPPQSTSESK